jgi:hypothetical protein
MTIILRLKCEQEGIHTYHKLVGLRFVCMSCEIMEQVHRDRAHVLDRIANHAERHGKKGDKNAS